MPALIKKDLMDKISVISRKIRDVEDFCKKIGVSPDKDVYFVALKSYKKSLEEMLVKAKEYNDC